MRRRLVLSTVLVVTVVLFLLAAPVTLVLRQAATDELEARTSAVGATVAAAIDDRSAQAEDTSVIDMGLTAEDIAVLLPEGVGVRVLDADSNELLSVDVADVESPFRRSFTTSEGVVVQAVTSSTDVDQRFLGQVGQLAILAVFGLAIAAGLAFIQARRIAAPLERLARAATRLGDGDFTANAPSSSGIEEIDSISRAIRLSGNRVERMLESERGFTADATHQLRTGLTGLAMRLELLERHPDPEVAAEAGTTLTQIHELNTTLDELLRVARQGSTGERTEFDLIGLVDHHVIDWQPQFSKKQRQIVVTTGRVEPVIGTPGLVAQILNVLIENALRHGRGTVAILVNGTSVLIEDEGPGIDDDAAATIFDRPSDHHAAHGRGLALARRLAEADGGRLELTAQHPATFTLSLLAVRH
jgi:signal transduction histidine kinase